MRAKGKVDALSRQTGFALVVACATLMAIASPWVSFAKTKSQPKNTPARAVTASLPLSDADQAWLKRAPLKTKVGQLMLIGFSGQDANLHLKRSIEQLHPGGIVVFSRNIRSPEQILKLNQRAQEYAIKHSKQHLLIAVDQEGGNVIRLRTRPALPSARAVAASGDREFLTESARLTASALKTLGFNMNLAPVVDVADADQDEFLGTRVYSDDPSEVSSFGGLFSQISLDHAVLPTLKHFPGHGGVADSHLVTPKNLASSEKLRRKDLVPFSEILKESPGTAVMLAHISYPSLDSSGMPATFSKPIVTDLLRQRLGFGGLVLTDDIEMAGAHVIKDPAERAVRSIEAGADIIMVAWNRQLQAKVHAGLMRAVRSGRISEARLEASLRRILAAKAKVASGPSKLNLANSRSVRPLSQALQSQELNRLSIRVLEATFQNARSKLRVDPASFGEIERPLFVFSAGHIFFDEFRRHAGQEQILRHYRLTANRSFDINRVLRSNPEAIAVIHVAGRQSAKYANEIGEDSAKRVVIINSESNVVLENPDRFLSVITVYFRHHALGRLTARYLFNNESIDQYEVLPSLRQPAQASGTNRDAVGENSSAGARPASMK